MPTSFVVLTISVTEIDELIELKDGLPNAMVSIGRQCLEPLNCCPTWWNGCPEPAKIYEKMELLFTEKGQTAEGGSIIESFRISVLTFWIWIVY